MRCFSRRLGTPPLRSSRGAAEATPKYATQRVRRRMPRRPLAPVAIPLQSAVRGSCRTPRCWSLPNHDRRSRPRSPPGGRELCRTPPRDAARGGESCEVRPLRARRGRGRGGTRLPGRPLRPGTRRAARGAAGCRPRGGTLAGGRVLGRRVPGRAGRALAAAGHPQRRRSGLGQGRRRQVDDGRQPRARACARRGARGAPRCRHLRSQPAAHDGPAGRPAHEPGRPAHRAARGARHQGHVDRVPDRGGAADGLARPDGHAGAHAAARRHPLGRTRLPRRRHAARHRRHPAHAVPARPGERGGDRHDPAGHRVARRPQGPPDVPESRDSRARRGREHEHARLLQLRARGADLRRRRRRPHGRPVRRRTARAAAARHPHPRGDRRRSSHGRRGTRERRRPGLFRDGAAHGGAAVARGRGGARRPPHHRRGHQK